MLSRRGDELPHAGGLGARKSLRVEGAFDDRQQRHFGRHATLLDFFNDVVQIFGTAIDKALDVIGAGGVPLLLLQHEWGIEFLHHEATTHPLPEIGIVELLCGEGVVRVLHVQLCGDAGVRACCCRRGGHHGCGSLANPRCGCGEEETCRNQFQALLQDHPKGPCF